MAIWAHKQAIKYFGFGCREEKTKTNKAERERERERVVVGRHEPVMCKPTLSLHYDLEFDRWTVLLNYSHVIIPIPNDTSFKIREFVLFCSFGFFPFFVFLLVFVLTMV